MWLGGGVAEPECIAWVDGHGREDGVEAFLESVSYAGAVDESDGVVRLWLGLRV